MIDASMKASYLVGVIGIILIVMTFLGIQAFLAVPKALETCYQQDEATAIADVSNIQKKKIDKTKLCTDWKKRIDTRVSCVDKVLATNPLAKLIGMKRDTAEDAKKMQQGMCK